jgi:hypothetical protein
MEKIYLNTQKDFYNSRVNLNELQVEMVSASETVVNQLVPEYAEVLSKFKKNRDQLLSLQNIIEESQKAIENRNMLNFAKSLKDNKHFVEYQETQLSPRLERNVADSIEIISDSFVQLSQEEVQPEVIEESEVEETIKQPTEDVSPEEKKRVERADFFQSTIGEFFDEKKKCPERAPKGYKRTELDKVALKLGVKYKS